MTTSSVVPRDRDRDPPNTGRDRLLAEAAAREAHLALILATVPDGMVVIDDHGIIQSFSATPERLFGYTAEEVKGRNVNVLPTPYRDRHDEYIACYLATGERRVIGSGVSLSPSGRTAALLSDRACGG